MEADVINQLQHLDNRTIMIALAIVGVLITFQLLKALFKIIILLAVVGIALYAYAII